MSTETISRLEEAEVLPLLVSDRVEEIAEGALQAAFKGIADELEGCGYPVTGDFDPLETQFLRSVFQGYVLRMALNNPDILRMQS